jgi:hypothetical protein
MESKKACYLCTYAFYELDEKPCESCTEYCNFDRRYKKSIKVKGDLAMEKISDKELEDFTWLFHKIIEEGGVKRPDILAKIIEELKERREADTVLNQMTRIVKECQDDIYYIVLDKKIPAKELLIHLANNDDIGVSFREEIADMMLKFFLKFGNEALKEENNSD